MGRTRTNAVCQPQLMLLTHRLRQQAGYGLVPGHTSSINANPVGAVAPAGGGSATTLCHHTGKPFKYRASILSALPLAWSVSIAVLSRSTMCASQSLEHAR